MSGMVETPCSRRRSRPSPLPRWARTASMVGMPSSCRRPSPLVSSKASSNTSPARAMSPRSSPAVWESCIPASPAHSSANVRFSTGSKGSLRSGVVKHRVACPCRREDGHLLPATGCESQDAGALQRREPRARHRLARREDDSPVSRKRAEEGAVVDGRPPLPSLRDPAVDRLGVQILIAPLGHATHNTFAYWLVKDSSPTTSTQGQPCQPHQASPVLSPVDSNGTEAYHPPRGMR